MAQHYNIMQYNGRSSLRSAAPSPLAALLAFWLNGQLVERNKVPVSDRMQVTTVTQTYEGNAMVYRMSFNTVSYDKAVVCEDGETVKCSELKLGDTIVLKKWKNNGWTWRFSPTQVV
ncbi:MAG: hypothetical protein ACM3KF_00720 [Acidobacteriota bacterium]